VRRQRSQWEEVLGLGPAPWNPAGEETDEEWLERIGADRRMDDGVKNT
jgi:hypothetical protein